MNLMINEIHQKREMLLEEALRLKDLGGDIEAFLSEHREIEQEARELFLLSDRIKSFASSMPVPDEGLRRALQRINDAEGAPIPSPLAPNSMIPVFLQFGVPIAAFAVILLMVVTTTTPSGSPAEFDINSAQMRSLEMESGTMMESGNAEDSGFMMMSTKMAPAIPEATGSVEDLRAALLAGATADREALFGDDEDFVYATADDGTLTSLIQTYDDTNL